jgi:hypothetical protein
VDTEHHVITHIHAYHADKKDSQCLSGIIKELKENLEPEGLLVEQILADTGYSSGTALKALEQNNITGYIPNSGQYKYERKGFTYHKEGDYYQCSQNKKLVSKRQKTTTGILCGSTAALEKIVPIVHFVPPALVSHLKKVSAKQPTNRTTIKCMCACKQTMQRR